MIASEKRNENEIESNVFIQYNHLNLIFFEIDSKKRTYNIFNIIKVENIVFITYNHFYSENFYESKRLLGNKELRIFSIEIKRIQSLYFIRLFLFRKLLQVQKIVSEQRT